MKKNANNIYKLQQRMRTDYYMYQIEFHVYGPQENKRILVA